MAVKIVTLALLVADEPIPLIKLRLESRVRENRRHGIGRCGTVMPLPIPIISCRFLLGVVNRDEIWSEV